MAGRYTRARKHFPLSSFLTDREPKFPQNAIYRDERYPRNARPTTALTTLCNETASTNASPRAATPWSSKGGVSWGDGDHEPQLWVILKMDGGGPSHLPSPPSPSEASTAYTRLSLSS